MYQENKQVHAVDFLFTLALFCIFAVTAFFVLFIGADIYQSTASNLGENSDAVTTMTYISEKVRQGDTADALSIETVEDVPVLALTSEVDKIAYVTYIYEWDEQLKELYCRKDTSVSLSGGETISSVSDFSIEEINEHLYRISLTDHNGQTRELLLSTRS